VRRDIRKLSEQGLITRHHGGAGRASSVVNTAFEQREVSLTEEKRPSRKRWLTTFPMARRCLSPSAPPLSRLPGRC
jgi:DeoR/GlpR family transcriptional regulator of sugar metabolism